MKSKFLNLSDEELQKLVSKRNQHAFEVIFNRYWKRLYVYAYKIYREEEICEDIVQEIFISYWNNEEGATILNLEAYLFKAVKYKIANHIRGLKFDKEHLDVLNNMASPVTTSEIIEYKEFETKVLNDIEKLSPKCREVFKLSRFESLSNLEISNKLNLSIHTVEKHISNALKELRDNRNVWQYHIIVILMFLEQS